MFKLTEPDPYREPRDVLPFPSEAVREFGWGMPRARTRPDKGACAAARRVEAAMAEVERRFGRLRILLENPDGDRPKAA